MSGQETRAAGWSAAAKAQEVRAAGRGGLLRRFLASFGLDPGAARVEAEAGRWEAGAKGEEMTAALLGPLAAEGWAGFYDRALPRGRANFDHVLVPPSGELLVLVDSKLWSRKRGAVRAVRGELLHGVESRQKALRSILHETGTLSALLDVGVVPVMVVHSAPVAGGRFELEGVTVIEAGQLVPLLRGLAGKPDPRAFARLSAAADRALPRYVQGSTR